MVCESSTSTVFYSIPAKKWSKNTTIGQSFQRAVIREDDDRSLHSIQIMHLQCTQCAEDCNKCLALGVQASMANMRTGQRCLIFWSVVY